MKNQTLISVGKYISQISKRLNRGNGSTWPGHIALKGNKNFIKDLLTNSKIKIIMVAGTNGKTTTSGLIKKGLETSGKSVIQNASGANLLNGIASMLLLNTDAQGKLTQDYAIFEVDENALPLVLRQVSPDYLVLLNLFRDQLDRYGEINTIAEKWKDAVMKLSEKTKLIINADDPQITFIGLHSNRKTYYFGLQEDQAKYIQDHAADSVSCPKCGNKLTFTKITFSHLGDWKCTSCGLHQPMPAITSFPFYPLSGTYNKYNTIAAALVLKENGLDEKKIVVAFKNFSPAFGRQEIIEYRGKQVQLFLSKNPTSFNQSFVTIQESQASTLLLVLNDRIPDGRDISWIWDVDLPSIDKLKHILIAGDRVYEMALRLKYELGEVVYNDKVQTFEKLEDAIEKGITVLASNEKLYILPNYSAMLDTRKIVTGKKIL